MFFQVFNVLYVPKHINTSIVHVTGMPRLQYDRKNKRYNLTIPKEIVIEKKMEKGDLVTFNTGEDNTIILKVIYKEKEYHPQNT